MGQSCYTKCLLHCHNVSFRKKVSVVHSQHTNPDFTEKISINFSSQILKIFPWQDLGNQKLKKEVRHCRMDLGLNPTYDQCVKTVSRMDVTTAQVSKKRREYILNTLVKINLIFPSGNIFYLCHCHLGRCPSVRGLLFL